MAAGRGLLGREITMTVGGATILGVITKDLSFAGTPIDVTDDQSTGYRELLAQSGLRTLDIAISGVVKNYALLRTFFDTSQMMACVINLGDGASTESRINCDAFLADLTIGAPANEGVTFSATLQSSGAITFTAGT